MNKNLKISHFEQISIRFSLSQVITGLLLGLAYAFAFYALLYVAREAFRVLSVSDVYDMWVLTDKEVRFFNLFYAYLAIFLGVSMAFQYIFERPKRMFEKQYRRKISILHDQRFLNWYFLSFFSKTALAFGLMFGVGFPHFYNAHYVIDFYPDYIYLFALIVLVLYLQMWVNIRRTFRGRSLKWMLGSFAIISLLAYGFAQIDIIDYKKLNRSFLQYNIFERYHLELPESDSYQKLFKSGLSMKIYLIENQINPEAKPFIIVDKKLIAWEQLPAIVSEWKEQHREEEKPLLLQHLFIDKDIKMKHIKQFKKALTKIYFRNVAYAVIPADKKYPKAYYQYTVLRYRLPTWYAYPFDFEHTWNDIKDYKNKIRLKLSASGQISVNGQTVADEYLQTKLKNLIDRHPVDYVIIFHINDDAHFQDYIKVIASIRKSIDDFRESYAQKTFGSTYRFLNLEQEKEVKEKYPLKLLEITPEIEKYLQENSNPVNSDY